MVVPKLRIYIVEDNMLMAASLRHILTGLGHCVCGQATTYKQAVNEMQKTGADLVITDIMLKGKKSGIDLGRFIKARLHIPFIYQSSVTENDIIMAAMDTLPGAYLFKPVTKLALEGAINVCNTIKSGISANENLSTFCPR
jgi:two-component SAPR family response regulator